MQYRVLGPLEVADGDRVVPVGGYRQRLLLAILVSRPGEHLRTDWLVDAVWGEHPPRTARKTLQAYVARLRALLGTAVIDSTQDGYRWAGAPSDIDSHGFEEQATVTLLIQPGPTE